ncbi:hypothetical protein [Elstera litoralis]|uniref:hypothetical protein n=1 Tax=Elstera litoralis TaxID=552518 RepID=UPI0018DC9E60|nr:hypothetical protein [Elstera litoralis]
MASEFQSSLDQAVREAEVDQLKQKMNAAVMEAEKDLPSIDLPSFSMQLEPAPVAAALPDPVPAMIESVPPRRTIRRATLRPILFPLRRKA